MYKVAISLLVAAAMASVLPQTAAIGDEFQSDRRMSEARRDRSSLDGDQPWCEEDDEDAFAAHRDSGEPMPACTSHQTVLGAQLTDSIGNATGTAVYRTWTLHAVADAEVTLDIQGAAPSTPLTATVTDVNGIVIATIGTLTTDANGNAYEEFATAIDCRETDKATLPANFPTLTSGEAIVVGTLSGELSTTLPPPLPPTPRPVEGTVLYAQLIDSTGNATGTAEYRTWTFHGVADAEVTLDIQGAAPSTPLTATVTDVNGIVIATIGTVTTDADGNAYEEFATARHRRETDKAALPANFPMLTPGEAIVVGTLSGELSMTPPVPPVNPMRRPIEGAVLGAQLTDSTANASDTGTAVY